MHLNIHTVSHTLQQILKSKHKEHTRSLSPILVSLYNIDSCLLLLWGVVYSGTDNINTLQLAVILHEEDLLISVRHVSMVSTDLWRTFVIFFLRHYICQPICDTLILLSHCNTDTILYSDLLWGAQDTLTGFSTLLYNITYPFRLVEAR